MTISGRALTFWISLYLSLCLPTRLTGPAQDPQASSTRVQAGVTP